MNITMYILIFKQSLLFSSRSHVNDYNSWGRKEKKAREVKENWTKHWLDTQICHLLCL